jgi:HEAT repeat protein
MFLVPALCVLLAGPRAAAREPEVSRQVETIERFAREPFEQREREAAVRALGRIGGAEAAAALLPLFEDPFVHLRDHAVSAWIAMVQGDRAAETVAWFAKKGVKHRSAEVRAGLATALGFATGPEAANLLGERLAKERDAQVLVALLRSVVRAGLPASDWKPAGLLRHRESRVVLATADALVRWDACAQVPPSIRAACREHREPLVRAAGVLVAHGAGDGVDAGALVARGAPSESAIALAEALGRMPPATAWSEIGPPLAVLLGADEWRVRAAAIDAALGQWRREVVPLLIERLALESGRLRLDLADALGALSGKDLGVDPELWRSWWEAAGADFDVGERPDSRRAPRAPAPEGETRTASFFRLPVYGTRIAFLLDCSGSMRDPLEKGRTGAKTKFELAQGELAQTLDGLDANVSFDVFLYRYPSEYPPRAELTRALGALMPWSKTRAKKATAWLERQEAKGWGAFSDALALLLADDVDTIYFLSDGRPSRGRFDRGFRLIDELERANRFRRVVIHTVLTGQERADREFLADLARSTGGRFSDAVTGSRR